MMSETYKPKYFCWYEENFWSDRRVVRMPPLARHFYRALLCSALFCRTRPFLPLDEIELQILADAEPHDWTIHRDTILGMFTKTERGYSHPRLDVQWALLEDQMKQWKEMGRRSAAKRSSKVQPPFNAGSTEQDVDLEQDLDGDATQQAAAARRDASASQKPKAANPAAVSPGREALAREHFAKLVESGDKWALSNQGDDSAFKRAAFVDHVLGSEPKRNGKKCKCGRPMPCDKHHYVDVPNAVPHASLDDPEPDLTCYMCCKVDANKGRLCDWHKDYWQRIKACPNCERNGKGTMIACEAHTRENRAFGEAL